MFSQSMCLGNDTLNALDHAELNPSEALDIIDESPTNKTCITSRSLRYRRQKQSSSIKNDERKSKDTTVNYSEFFRSDLQLGIITEPKPPESIECIDESPNHETTNVTSRSTRLRSKNQTKIDKHKPKPAEAVSISSENYSEFFKNNLDFGEVPEKSPAKLVALATDSLDKFFNTNFESITNPINVNLFQNLDEMFQESEFYLQPSEPQLLDVAITHTEDFADLSFGDCSSFTVNQAMPKAASQVIEWDDSSELFNNIVIPTNVIELANRPQTQLMVNDEVALGIDNVTFAQEFLPQRMVENNSMSEPQKTVAQFMSEEMDKCIDVVKSALGEDEVVSTSFIGSQKQLSHSSLTNIVLNWSLDNVPKTKAVESINYATPQVVQTTSRSLPQTNLSSIESWGLSKEIVQGYVKKGIQTMFPWQVECLSNIKVGLLLNYF